MAAEADASAGRGEPLSVGGIAVAGPLWAVDDQREQAAQRQHEGAVYQKALAGAEAVGDPAHDRRDQDRAEPLAGLAQPNDGALLVAADRTRLHRQDDRL